MSQLSVELTEHELKICAWVGKQRYSFARNSGWSSGHKRPGNESHDINGAEAEYACALILNLSWRPSIGSLNALDVGGIIQVRRAPVNGRLPIKDRDLVEDKKMIPYALVIKDGSVFFMPGWAFPIDALAFDSEDYGDPARYIPRHALRPCASLIAYIKERR